MTYTPSTALVELLAQHATLRGMMEHCEELAEAIDRSGAPPTELTREVAKLRIAFEMHNKFEEQMLRPILLAQDAFGDVRIDKMVEEHIHEHGAIRGRLDGWVTGQLREVISNLRSHLDAEERYFLSSRILRDDLVSIEHGG